MDDADAEINVNQNKEENDQNTELAPITSQIKFPFPDVDEATENIGIILTAPDKRKRLQITPSDCSSGRRSQQNVLKKASEPMHLM